MVILNEDDIYRSSTQYRFWAFALESLSSLRQTTNTLAANGVRAAVRQQKAGDDARLGDDTESSEVDCLTVEEEQKLVGFYCVKAMQLADFCDFPTNVKATAVQYLKRFYLSNSPMTYHPKEIMPSALFLSTKTENHYTSLRNFTSKLSKTTADDVIAPEFLLTQARGIAEERYARLTACAHYKKSTKNTETLIARIQAAHGRAKDFLKTSALLTDVYFHYTPSQIWLAAFMLADEPLTIFYIDSVMAAPEMLKAKLKAALHVCMKMLEAAPSADPGESEMKELMKIDKKLYKCRNPEKMDLVSINKAQRQEGGGDGKDVDDKKVVKKRKLEQEKKDDDIFGPAI